MLTDAVRATALTPVVWSLLGYQFEAGAMLGAVGACLTVRLWLSLNSRASNVWTWTIDATVSLLALLFTAGWVMLSRPTPFYAILGGTGFGALGAGIITIALAWVRAMAPGMPHPSDRSQDPTPPAA